MAASTDPRVLRRMSRTDLFTRSINRSGSGVSKPAKVFLFMLNLLLWATGGLLLGVGLYAKTQSNSWDSLGGIGTDPALLLCVIGGVVFFLGFTGAIGALREQQCLLKMYMYSMIILVVVEIAAVALAFAFRTKVEAAVTEKIGDAIQQYHTTDVQTDLDDAIESLQKSFQCCGGNMPRDWITRNMYHNCTQQWFGTLLTACGVPPSCCRNGSSNIQCGYKVYAYPGMPFSELAKWPSIDTRDLIIYTKGCGGSFIEWIKNNYILIGSVAITIIVVQLITIFMAANILNTIKYLLSIPV